MTNIKKQRGSVALISILIISAMLLIVSVGMSESNISTMYSFLNNESNQIMYHVAEGCLEESIVRIKDDTNFAGTTLALGDANCTATVAGGSTKTITIDISYLEYNQNFSAQVYITTQGEANNIQLLSWEKI